MASMSFEANNCSYAFGPPNIRAVSIAGLPSLADTSSIVFLPFARLSWKRSPMAVTTAPVFSRNELVTPRPRPPQPSTPRRTAEFAWLPNTTLGFSMVMVAAAAALPTNCRRLTRVSLDSLMALPSCIRNAD